MNAIVNELSAKLTVGKLAVEVSTHRTKMTVAEMIARRAANRPGLMGNVTLEIEGELGLLVITGAWSRDSEEVRSFFLELGHDIDPFLTNKVTKVAQLAAGGEL